MARERRRGDWKRERVKGVSRAVSVDHPRTGHSVVWVCGGPDLQVRMYLGTQVLLHFCNFTLVPTTVLMELRPPRHLGRHNISTLEAYTYICTMMG